MADGKPNTAQSKLRTTHKRATIDGKILCRGTIRFDVDARNSGGLCTSGVPSVPPPRGLVFTFWQRLVSLFSFVPIDKVSVISLLWPTMKFPTETKGTASPT